MELLSQNCHTPSTKLQSPTHHLLLHEHTLKKFLWYGVEWYWEGIHPHLNILPASLEKLGDTLTYS